MASRKNTVIVTGIPWQYSLAQVFTKISEALASQSAMCDVRMDLRKKTQLLIGLFRHRGF